MLHKFSSVTSYLFTDHVEISRNPTSILIKILLCKILIVYSKLLANKIQVSQLTELGNASRLRIFFSKVEM